MVTALQAVVIRIGTLADGTIRLTCDLTTDDLAQVAALAPVHQTIAIAPIQGMSALNLSGGDNSQQGEQSHSDSQKSLTEDSRPSYGMHAKELKLCGFFRNEAVFTKVGSDREFLHWIRKRPKSATGKLPSESNPIEAAHVRRVEHGAGTGIKPEYSAIPLLHSEHAEQHAQGESVIGDDEWWQTARISYLEAWAWETLKENLGFDSWRDVPPNDLVYWAIMNGVEKYLPVSYREFLNETP